MRHAYLVIVIKSKNGKFVLGYDIHYTFVDEDGFYKIKERRKLVIF
mgnify:CR=1 FL=1